MKPSIFTLCIVAVFTGTLYCLPPINDNFADANILAGSYGSVPGHNSDASIEPGEPVHAPFQQSYNSVWWSWTAPAGGEYTFDVKSASFNPYIRIYTGNSLTGLVRASDYRQLYTHFRAEQNTTYYIVVFSTDNEYGGITLRYYPDTLSGEIQECHHGNDDHTILASRKGAVAYQKHWIDYMDVFRTNKYGDHFNGRSWGNYTTPGLTVINAKGSLVVSNTIPSSLGTNFFTRYFDGKQLYAYKRATGKLVVYRVKKNALQEKGSQVIGNVNQIHMKGAYVIVQYENYTTDTFMPVQWIIAFDRNLKKKVWEEPASLGRFESFTDKGIYRHVYNGEYYVTLSLHKKGKKNWHVHIPYPHKKDIKYQTDRNGNTLYWYFTSYYPQYTNGPITLISRTGKTVLDHITLPGVGDAWMNSNFERNRFFVLPPPSGNTYTVYGYKLGKKIKTTGPVTANSVMNTVIHEPYATIMQFNPIPPIAYGLTQYDTNLKKMQWQEPMAQGFIRHVDKDVFLRQTDIINAGKTNLLLKIFGRKGVITEHEVPK